MIMNEAERLYEIHVRDEHIAALRSELERLRRALERIAEPDGMGVHRPSELRLKGIARDALTPPSQEASK
jgi:plasmid stabilization system protein ParE